MMIKPSLALLVIASFTYLHASQMELLLANAPLVLSGVASSIRLETRPLIVPTESRSAPEVFDSAVIATHYMTAAQIADVRSYTGALDLTATINHIISHNTGRTIRLPSGKWNFTSRINVPMGTTIEGEGWGELPTSASNHGTVIVQNYNASTDPYGFYVIATGAQIRNLEIQQPQPAPGADWTPNVGPWAIFAFALRYQSVGGHRLTVDHVMLRNVYDGIRLQDVRGGYLRDIYGQPFDKGVYISGNSDEPHLDDIHLGWTYWSGDANVMAYQESHLDSFTFGRVDGPKGVNLFSFGANRAFRFFYDTSHGDANYDGVAQAAALANIEGDGCNVCLAIEDNPEVMLTNWHASPNSNTLTSTCLFSYSLFNPPSNYGNLRLTINAGTCSKPSTSGLQFAFTPPGTPLYPQYIKLIGMRISSPFGGTWSTAMPAIVASPGVQVYAPDLTVDAVTDTSIMLNGGVLLLPSRTRLDPRITRSDIQDLGNLSTLQLNGSRIDGSWTAYTPAFSCSIGIVRSNSPSTSGFYKRIDKTIIVTISVVTPPDYLGTCKFPALSLPFEGHGAASQLFPARESRSGSLWSGTLIGGGLKVYLSKYDGTGTLVPNSNFIVQGVYWGK